MPTTSNSDRTSSRRRDISRRAFLGAVGAGTTAVAAGCLGLGEQDIGTGTEGGSPGTEGGATGTQGGFTGTARSGTVRLTFWHQENVPGRIDVFEELNQRFMDEHDDIEVQQQPQTWGNIYAQLQSAVEAGNEPDFWFTTPALASTFQAQGELVDVSEMMDELDSEYSYYDRAKVHYEYNDGVWGIPNWNKGFNTIYHEPDFSETDNWPPETWEDWLASMTAVTNADETTYGFVLGATSNHFSYKAVMNMMGMKGSYVFGPDGDIMFNTEDTVQMLDFYKQAFDQAVPDGAVNWSWPQWDRSLRQETVLSTSCYPAPFPNIQSREQQRDWDTIKNPAPSGGPWGDGESRRWVSIDGVSVFNEEKVDAITEYMRFIHRPDVYGWWMRNANPCLFVPIHEAGWESETYWEGAHSKSPFQEMVEKQHDLSNITYPGFRDIHIENDVHIGEALGVIEGSFPLGGVASQLITNDRSPQEAAEWGQNRLEELTDLPASDRLSGGGEVTVGEAGNASDGTTGMSGNTTDMTDNTTGMSSNTTRTGSNTTGTR